MTRALAYSAILGLLLLLAVVGGRLAREKGGTEDDASKLGEGYEYQPGTLARLRRLVEGEGWTLAVPPRNPQGMLQAVHEWTGLTFVLIPAGSFQVRVRLPANSVPSPGGICLERPADGPSDQVVPRLERPDAGCPVAGAPDHVEGAKDGQGGDTGFGAMTFDPRTEVLDSEGPLLRLLGLPVQMNRDHPPVGVPLEPALFTARALSVERVEPSGILSSCCS